MKNFEEIRKRWMEDPEVRRYYEEMAAEFEAIQADIANDEEPPISEDSDQRKAVTLKEVIASLPEERQERIKKLSNSIFADVGLDNADELHLHGVLGCQVVNSLQERSMTHEEIAALLGIDLDNVAHLMNGHFDQFSIDSLIHFSMQL